MKTLSILTLLHQVINYTSKITTIKYIPIINEQQYEISTKLYYKIVSMQMLCYIIHLITIR